MTSVSRFLGGMDDPRVAFPVYEKARELGINLIAVHKGVPLGPQPLEGTQVYDIDQAAANFPDLNFIIFHPGLPFIEEICWQNSPVSEYLCVAGGNAELHRQGPPVVRRSLGEAVVLGRPGQNHIRLGGPFVAPAMGAQGLLGVPDAPGPDRRIRLSPTHSGDQGGKILGENLARLHGIDVEAKKAEIANDEFAQRRASGLATAWSSS